MTEELSAAIASIEWQSPFGVGRRCWDWGRPRQTTSTPRNFAHFIQLIYTKNEQIHPNEISGRCVRAFDTWRWHKWPINMTFYSHKISLETMCPSNAPSLEERWQLGWHGYRIHLANRFQAHFRRLIQRLCNYRNHWNRWCDKFSCFVYANLWRPIRDWIMWFPTLGDFVVALDKHLIVRRRSSPQPTGISGDNESRTETHPKIVGNVCL